VCKIPKRNFNFDFGFILFFLLILGGASISCVGDVEKKQVEELKRIASQTPVFPGFQQTGEKAVLKRGVVYLFIFYRSQAQFSEVKSFYTTELASRGWGAPQQDPPSLLVGDKNSVSYRRGEYLIVVEHAGSQTDNFDVVFKWEPE
jgi:hypothetical protein